MRDLVNKILTQPIRTSDYSLKKGKQVHFWSEVEIEED